VLPASDGIDGLRVAASTPIDLILSDVMMPRMGGPELVQQFLLVHPAPVVMFMSGYAEEALMAEVRLISSAVLRKPFSPAILARAVRDALDASRTSKLAVAV
jgi:two-component system cell cycle sensor histidine kinase/response regulator CckA